MIRLFVKGKIFKFWIVLLLWISSVGGAFAQPDCRSVLGAYLQPVGNSESLRWASEVIAAPGGMEDRFIFNGMAYVGIDYLSKNQKHQVYFEGAYKHWYNSAKGPGEKGTGSGYADFNAPEKKHFGLRELYYSYPSFFNSRVGIQTMKSAHSMLIDERVLGLSVEKKLGEFNMLVQGGTVYDDIARMQDVCGTRHLYNLVRGSKVNFVGDELFDANFIHVEIGLVPGQKKDVNEDSSDEFASFETEDEFESGSEFDEFSNDQSDNLRDAWVKLSRANLRFYSEFGPVFFARKYYTGADIHLALTNDIAVTLEVLGQWMDNNNAVFFKVELEKERFWNNGSFTKVTAGLLYNNDIDDNVNYSPSFSNLFKGEIMRLDMMHLPLLEFNVQHKFNSKKKSSMRLNYIHQLKDAKTMEFDAIYSVHAIKNLHLNFIGGIVSSEVLDNENFLVRLEAHFAF